MVHLGAVGRSIAAAFSEGVLVVETIRSEAIIERSARSSKGFASAGYARRGLGDVVRRHSGPSKTIGTIGRLDAGLGIAQTSRWLTVLLTASVVFLHWETEVDDVCRVRHPSRRSLVFQWVIGPDFAACLELRWDNASRVLTSNCLHVICWNFMGPSTAG